MASGIENLEKDRVSLEDVKVVVSHASRWILMTHLYRKGEILYSEAKSLLSKHGLSSNPLEIRRHFMELEKCGLITHEERKPYIITATACIFIYYFIFERFNSIC